MPHPDQDDVVVRRTRGDPEAIFVLGTPPAPDQVTLRTCGEAVSHALAFAKRQRVDAWFTNGGGELVLLGTFRQDIVASAGDVLATRNKNSRRTPSAIAPAIR